MQIRDGAAQPGSRANDRCPPSADHRPFRARRLEVEVPGMLGNSHPLLSLPSPSVLNRGTSQLG
jgi:hypothetical protein